MKLKNELSQKQLLIITPRMEQALLCLQLPFVELEEYISKEIEENPLFDFEDLNPLPLKDMEFFDRFSLTGKSLKEHLIELVELSEMSEELKKLCLEIIYRLDPRGLLSSTIQEIAEELGVSPQTITAAREALREFAPAGTAAESEEECFTLRGDNTYPSTGFANEDHATHFIEPDIIISMCGEELKFEIRHPDIKLSSYYLKLMENGDARLKRFLKKMKKKADALIYGLKKREETLTAIAQVLIDLNRDYFLERTSEVKRISISELAEHIEHSKSTASRAVNSKYVLSPRGLHPLNFFFGDSGQRAEALFKISEILQEQPDLTDKEIAERLKAFGISISRRTVNKYRHMLVKS